MLPFFIYRQLLQQLHPQLAAPSLQDAILQAPEAAGSVSWTAARRHYRRHRNAVLRPAAHRQTSRLPSKRKASVLSEPHNSVSGDEATAMARVTAKVAGEGIVLSEPRDAANGCGDPATADSTAEAAGERIAGSVSVALRAQRPNLWAVLVAAAVQLTLPALREVADAPAARKAGPPNRIESPVAMDTMPQLCAAAQQLR